MAINKDNSLKAYHCCYTAGTGGGKSVAVQYGGKIPKSPCLVLFDPYGDYEYEKGNDKNNGFAGKRVYHYETRVSFSKAFTSAWFSKKPFRIAYRPKKPNRAEMLWLCDLVWLASDGNRRLDCVIEELAKFTESIAKENSILGECLTGGRKFGLVMHTVFQRSTEVSKTILSQSPYKFIGLQQSRADAKRMADECDISLDDILELEPLRYYLKGERMGDINLVDLRYVFEPKLKPNKTNKVLVA